MTAITHKLIHVAKKQGDDGVFSFLFLRQDDKGLFTWWDESTPTNVFGKSAEEAIKAAYTMWKKDFFTPVPCGFCYTLPERDEHGINALFYQMSASLSSMNGVYFDEELGHLCQVQGIPLATRELWEKLR